MSHIVYCWELGDDLGYLAPWVSVARELVNQGHQVSCILRDLAHARRYLSPLGIRWYQAPIALREPGKDSPPLNHADILHGQGYAQADHLQALLEGWRNLLQLLQADRIIVDAAPTAILAARSLRLPVMALDAGFFMPPLTTPLPALRDWEKPSPDILLQREARTLGIINAALDQLNAPRLPDFKSLFAVETRYRTWPQTNHFGPHSPEKHLGPILISTSGIAPSWPAGDGGKVFAYLKPEHPRSLETLEALINAGFRVLAYLPRFAQSVLDRLEATGRINTSATPIDLTPLSDIDLVICHSGSGLVAGCLANGQRLLLLPMHVEQVRVARAVQHAGLPAGIIGEKTNIQRCIHALLQLPHPNECRKWPQLNVVALAREMAIGSQ